MNSIIICLGIAVSVSIKIFGFSVEKNQAQLEVVHDTQVIIEEVDNGIELWTRYYNKPSDSIALRLVLKDRIKGVPVIFALDCSSSNLERDIQCFLEDHRESLGSDSNTRLGVVLVGNFHDKEINPHLKNFLSCLQWNRSYEPSLEGNRISIAPYDIDDENEGAVVSLTYPMPIHRMEDEADLKKLWMFYLLNQLVQEQLAELALEHNLFWESGREDNYPLPPACISVKGTYNHPQEGIDMVSEFVMKVGKWARLGIDSPELFNIIKQKLLKQMILSLQPEVSNLADYYASIFALDKGCPDYLAFVRQSTEVIKQIKYFDIFKIAGEIFCQPFVHIDLIPESGGKIKDTASLMGGFEINEDPFLKNSLESDPCTLKFSELSITSDEIEKIRTLIKTVASENIFQLLMKKRQLDRIGDEIRHVHPMRFLMVVFSDPVLKAGMSTIEGSLFKWGHFVGGLAERLDQESTRGNLSPYIQGFCELVKADIRKVELLIRKKKWNQFVKYLIQLSD